VYLLPPESIWWLAEEIPMNDPTQSDLEKLLERMREERERADGAAPDQVAASFASNVLSSVPAAEERAGTQAEGQHRLKAELRTSVAAENGRAGTRPEPSKLIFGRDLRNPDPLRDVYIPPQFRVDPKKVHIDSLLIERLGMCRNGRCNGSGRDGFPSVGSPCWRATRESASRWWRSISPPA